MNITGRTILITGGGTGIGFAIAETLIKRGNNIIICGRREDKLKIARENIPGLEYRVCDVSQEEQASELYEWIIKKHPELEMLINNAGIQQMFDFTNPVKISEMQKEIEIDFMAPVMLCSLFIKHFKTIKETAIVNVSSGLAFAPLANMPVYCASKAALHSFTLSLRFQLRNTGIKVFELVPPMVDTELDRGSREKRSMEFRGISPDQVAEEFIKGLESDTYEILVGNTNNLKESGEKNFFNMNRY